MKGLFEKRCVRWNVCLLICGWMILSLSVPSLAEEDCPQYRDTPGAPQKFLEMKNPLPKNDRNLKFGQFIYQLQGQPIACKACHGAKGDGKAESGYDFDKAPRNFTCKETMKPLPDGQLFWIIRNGSPHSRMYAFPSLTDKQIWQLVHYIRQFSNK